MNLKQLKRYCENTPLAVHHAQFEYAWLLDRGIDPNIVNDTFLMAHLYDERLPLDFESLCLRFGVDKVFKEEYGLSVGSMSPERCKERNTRDARNVPLLRDKLWSKLTNSEKKVYEKVLLPASRSLALVELQGIAYDPKRVQGVVRKLTKQIDELDIHNDPYIAEFERNSGKEFNIDSWLHRGMVIFDLMGYDVLPFKQALTDKTQNPSTKKKVLQAMLKKRHTPTLEKIINFTSWSGWREHYEQIENICEKCGRPHTIEIDGVHYILTSLNPVASTGRVISDHPNMQNNPSHDGANWTRRVFTPRTGIRKGCIVEADYDQIELRILAGVSGDERLIEDFRSGLDPHIEMAKIAFNKKNPTKVDRFEAKTLNFGIPFGMGAASIAFNTGRTYDEANTFKTRYWKEHPELKRFLKNLPQSGIVESVSGMKRHCETWMQSKNYQTQNPAYVAMLVGLNRTVDDAIRWNCPIDLLVHDSFRFDFASKKGLKKTLKKFKESLELEAYEIYSDLPIPLTVGFKVGPSWGEMEDYEV